MRKILVVLLVACVAVLSTAQMPDTRYNLVSGGVNGSYGVGGLAADGALAAGNPVLIAGSDGTRAESILTDSSGRPNVVGAAADGAALAGNPVLIAGSDGTNAQTLTTNLGGVGTDTLRIVVPTNDPCQNAGIVKSSVSVTATADAELVALASGQTIYVCGFSFNAAAGTGPGFRLIYGTGATCATGTTGLTGIYLPTVGTTFATPGGGTQFATASANALCIDVSGTTPDIRGYLTYVQRAAP